MIYLTFSDNSRPTLSCHIYSQIHATEDRTCKTKRAGIIHHHEGL